MENDYEPILESSYRYRWNMQCPKCGKFVSNKHLTEAWNRGTRFWEYCPKCILGFDPEWQSQPIYEGLYCTICGEKSGNTDLCVDCCIRIQKEEKKNGYEI